MLDPHRKKKPPGIYWTTSSKIFSNKRKKNEFTNTGDPWPAWGSNPAGPPVCGFARCVPAVFADRAGRAWVFLGGFASQSVVSLGGPRTSPPWTLSTPKCGGSWKSYADFQWPRGSASPAPGLFKGHLCFFPDPLIHANGMTTKGHLIRTNQLWMNTV